MHQNDFVYQRKNGTFSSHETILRLIGGGESILDLGASNGILYNELKNRGFKVTCVDFEEPSKVSLPKEDYIYCNLENYESLKLDQKYDYIILADVIEHLRNAPGLLQYIKKFLKEDGKVIISVPNIAIWVYRLSLFLGLFDYTEKGTLDETHVRFYTKKTILKLIQDSNYSVEEFRPTSLPFEVVFKGMSGNVIIKMIEYGYYGFAFLWQKLFAYQFVIQVKALK